MSMDVLEFDYLVIGSGLAGQTFSLHSSSHGSVALITKAELSESNTSYAQGGIAAAVGESDSWELHEEDTLIAGAGLCDRDAVRFLVQNAPSAIHWLASLGVRFDRNGDHPDLTTWALGREGGHSRNRILHYEDRTGWEVERAMNEAVRSSPSISIFENVFVLNLIVDDGECTGALVRLPNDSNVIIGAKCTFLATGGCGRLYQHTTNPRIATGDGVALAGRVGAEIKDMEFMQFHPTTLYHPQARSFLITEAARGEGGTLRNHLGERFMYRYDERLELAPRDVVARAIDEEMRLLETWCVYLDLTHLTQAHIQQHFPTIVEKLKTVGIEPHRHWIPIVPAQHYSCGGVVTDLRGQTSVRRLLAGGEVARTGVHGANRLASNSLLEALVFSKAAAEVAVELPAAHSVGSSTAREPKSILETDALRIRRTMEKIMMDQVGIVRRTAGLQDALRKIQELTAEYDRLPSAPYSQYSLETLNLLQTAPLVIQGALDRRQNVGLHFNADLE